MKLHNKGCNSYSLTQYIVQAGICCLWCDPSPSIEVHVEQKKTPLSSSLVVCLQWNTQCTSINAHTCVIYCVGSEGQTHFKSAFVANNMPGTIYFLSVKPKLKTCVNTFKKLVLLLWLLSVTDVIHLLLLYRLLPSTLFCFMSWIILDASNRSDLIWKNKLWQHKCNAAKWGEVGWRWLSLDITFSKWFYW